MLFPEGCVPAKRCQAYQKFDEPIPEIINLIWFSLIEFNFLAKSSAFGRFSDTQHHNSAAFGANAYTHSDQS